MIIYSICYQFSRLIVVKLPYKVVPYEKRYCTTTLLLYPGLEVNTPYNLSWPKSINTKQFRRLSRIAPALSLKVWKYLFPMGLGSGWSTGIIHVIWDGSDGKREKKRSGCGDHVGLVNSQEYQCFDMLNRV